MRSLISIPLLLLICGCSDIGYYWHSARGHLDIMNQRVDIDQLLADENTAADLRARLLLVQEMRRFSVERLDLPDNGSYSSYVQLQRPYVVQNLFAATEFSTRLHQWCYPVIGCASYRGYHDASRMLQYADELKAQGFEVHIGRVPAYSTLGWFDDPVLSSFIDWPEYRLAGLLFHELTHQRIYIDDDTTFNESLASAVQQVGTELWLRSNKDTDGMQKLSRWQSYSKEVIALIESTRNSLTAIYASELDEAQMRERKSRQLEAARDQHAHIADRHGIKNGFNAWFSADLNNAKIGSVSAYNSRTTAFVQMLRANGNDFAAFYSYVEQLARLDRAARDRCLDAWDRGDATADSACLADDGRPIDEA